MFLLLATVLHGDGSLALRALLALGDYRVIVHNLSVDAATNVVI